MERLVPVVQVMVHMECDQEGCKGEMLATGEAFLCHPAKYPHVCDVCGHKETYTGHKYPSLEFREATFG